MTEASKSVTDLTAFATEVIKSAAQKSALEPPAVALETASSPSALETWRNPPDITRPCPRRSKLALRAVRVVRRTNFAAITKTTAGNRKNVNHKNLSPAPGGLQEIGKPPFVRHASRRDGDMQLAVARVPPSHRARRAHRRPDVFGAPWVADTMDALRRTTRLAGVVGVCHIPRSRIVWRRGSAAKARHPPPNTSGLRPARCRFSSHGQGFGRVAQMGPPKLVSTHILIAYRRSLGVNRSICLDTSPASGSVSQS